MRLSRVNRLLSVNRLTVQIPVATAELLHLANSHVTNDYHVTHSHVTFPLGTVAEMVRRFRHIPPSAT